MNKVRELGDIQLKVERLRQERDRAQGRLDATMKLLQQEFKVDSIEAAQELLEKLQQKEAQAKTQFEKALAHFTETWGEELG